MTLKCRQFGHQWNTHHEDAGYTYEECLECCDKKKFYKHGDRRAYAEEHSADLIQEWDQRFAILYPAAVVAKEKEAKEMKESEDNANEKLEQAAHAIKRSSLTTKFVH